MADVGFDLNVRLEDDDDGDVAFDLNDPPLQHDHGIVLVLILSDPFATVL